jgi:hypothetical protein
VFHEKKSTAELSQNHVGPILELFYTLMGDYFGIKADRLDASRRQPSPGDTLMKNPTVSLLLAFAVINWLSAPTALAQGKYKCEETSTPLFLLSNFSPWTSKRALQRH